MRGLQKRGQQVVPLKYRRETPLKPIPVEALCDFEGEQVSSSSLQPTHSPPRPPWRGYQMSNPRDGSRKSWEGWRWPW